MAKKPFVVLDAEILSSSVWSEAPHVKLVWITLLVLCDTEGYVGAALPGIARAAGVSLKETENAMEKLMAPDPYSRTQRDEGRRVELAERGYRVLNFLEHVDRLSSERKKARERVRRFRERRNGNVTVTPGNVTVRPGNREQGTVNSEQGRKEGTEPPALPPADRTERAIRQTTDALRTKLYALVDEAKTLDPKHRDPTELMRLFTSYSKRDGKPVGGVVNAGLLSFERLEKSIADAEEQLGDWRGQRQTQ